MLRHSTPTVHLPTLKEGHDPQCLFYYYDLFYQQYNNHMDSIFNYHYWTIYALSRLQSPLFLNDPKEDISSRNNTTYYLALDTYLKPEEQTRFWRFLRKTVAKTFTIENPIHAQYLIVVENQTPSFISLEHRSSEQGSLQWAIQLAHVYKNITKEQRDDFHTFLQEGMQTPWHTYQPQKHDNTYLLECYETYQKMGPFNPTTPHEYQETELFMN